MQAARRISLPQIRLTVLDDRPFTQDRLRPIQGTAGNVHHGDFEVREREIGIKVGHSRERPKALFTPGGVRHSEVMRPLPRLECHGATRGGERFSRASGADKKKCQRCVRFGKIALELYSRPPDVIDRAGKKRSIGLGSCPRHLVLPEPGIAKANVGRRVMRIQLQRAFKTLDRGGNLFRVERLELQACFREGLVGLEAAGLPMWTSGQVR